MKPASSRADTERGGYGDGGSHIRATLPDRFRSMTDHRPPERPVQRNGPIVPRSRGRASTEQPSTGVGRLTRMPDMTIYFVSISSNRSSFVNPDRVGLY